MATLSEQHLSSLGGTIISQDDAPPRQPPLLVVGPLAWIKKNLFNTVYDTALTLMVTLVMGTIIVSFVSWTVGQANWYSINFNLRLLMVGRYEPAAEWRVTIVVLLTAFTIGLALAAWAHVRRQLVVVLGVIIALTFIIPPLIYATLSLPPFYASAGQVKIGGDNGQSPQSQVAFTGRAGETVTVRLAEQYSASEDNLARLHSFADPAANAALNAAANRLSAQRRIAELTALLAGDTLTGNQRGRAENELSKLTIPDSVIDSLKLNQQPVQVAILQGTTLQPLPGGAATLESGSTSLSVTLPEDGWYVLQKSLEDKDAIALLETTGIYPVLERTITRGGEDGAPAAGSLSQYVRMTDIFTTEAEVPQDDNGRDMPFVVATANPYRGETPFNDYLRLYVAPFLNQINVFLLVVTVAGAAGYMTGRWLDRFFSLPERPRYVSGRTATWLLIVMPVLSLILIYGLTPEGLLPLTDTRRWGGVLLTMLLTVVGIIGSLPLGILLALGRRSKAPVISTVCTIYIELIRGVPFITVLFMAQLLIPLINPELSSFPGAFRAMIATVLFTAAYNAEVVRGGLQAIPPGQEEAAKAVGLNSLQITLYITLPQALRLVIPPMMGNFVGMFKDTSLVAIVGLLDLTGMAQNVYAQTEFLGLRREVLMFIALFYFGVSYVIAAVSRRIETSGSGRAIKMQI